MIKEWFENNYFIYIIGGICILGVLIRFILSMKYRHLIRASKRMGTSKNKLMRVLRLKFETCYKLKIGVNNVDTFVDKYVYRHRFCGLYLYTWETISGEFIVVSVLSASVFSVLGLIYKCGQNDILYTFASGILSAIVLIGYDFFINLRMKRKVLKVNIKDYLENFLKSRLENVEFNSELLEQYRKEYFDLPNTKMKKKNKKTKKVKEPKEELPLVAQVESAVTEDAPVKEELVKEELVKEELVKEELVKEELVKEEKSVKEEKPVVVTGKGATKDVGALRREAKKNELKKMIEADKAKRVKQEEVHIEHIPYERMVHKPEEKVVEKEAEKIAEVPKKETAAVEQTIKETKQDVTTSKAVEQPTIISKYNISSEEAKLIEDILKEYLA